MPAVTGTVSLVGEVDDMIWQAVHAGFGYFQREASDTRTGSHGTRVPAGRPASGTRPTWPWRTGCSTPRGTATCSCTSTPRSPTSPGPAPTEVAGAAFLGYNEHIGAVAAIVSQHLEEALTARLPGMDLPR